MTLPVRESVRVLLLNKDNELLLLCGDDPNVRGLDGRSYGRFWFTVGGGIEPGEDLFEAAYRETYEETGISGNDLEMGPAVWFGSYDMCFYNIPTCMKQVFVVARSQTRQLNFDRFDEHEKSVIQDAQWFSLEKIKASPDPVFPRLLPQYLPDILAGRYPDAPFWIDLSRAQTTLYVKQEPLQGDETTSC